MDPVAEDSEHADRVAGQSISQGSRPARLHTSLATVGVPSVVGYLRFDNNRLAISASVTYSF